MKINHIRIQNFYSVKKIDLQIDKLSGIVLVEGNNKDTGSSNGAGKSVILEAIVWGLFGKTIRKSTEAAMVNTDVGKECVVKIHLTTDRGEKVVIERSRRPTSLTLEVDGEARTRDHANSTQTEIDTTLQTNYKVFMASIVFGQHNNLDFISASPDDKRIILRNFLHLEDMFARRDKIKRLKSEFSQTVKSVEAVISELESQNITVEEEIEALEELNGDIELPTITLEEILEAEDTVRELKQDIAIAKQKQRDYIGVANNFQSQVDQGPYSKEEKCRTCGSLVEHTVDQEEIDRMQKLADQQFLLADELELVIHGFEKDLLCVTPEISSKEYSKNKNIIEAASKILLKKQQIKLNGERIVELKAERKEAKTNYEIMRFWEKAFSEQGLVKYVIRNILDYFNSQCNIFLSHVSNGQFYIKFDEELKETIHTNGREVQHISLSGGEKRKVNIAVLLALHSLLNLTGKSQSDLLFFDEIAENLDPDGLYGLYILLTEIKKDKTIFLITHNNYLKSLVENDSVLTITKKNGESFIAKEN